MSQIKIMGLQKVTLLDYPGRVACTVFLGGCNLRCPFCHNASLVVSAGETEPMDEAALFAFLRKRQGILDGVCVTGGEPLLWSELPRLLAEIRALGYAVKLDTNGTMPERLAPLLRDGAVDYVAMDVKSSPDGYARAAGVSVDVDKIRESIRMIRESGVAHEFRTTVVAGIHTQRDVVEAAALVGDSPYFLQSFVDSGDLIGGEGIAMSDFTPDEMRALRDAARVHAPLCEVRGVDS